MLNKKPLTTRIKVLVGCAVVGAVVIGVAATNVTGSSTTNASPLNKAVLVSAGSDTSQIITEDGNRYARGENEYGQLGVNNYDSQSSWAAGEGSFIKISSPYDHTIALDKSGLITTWGGNRYNALATGNHATSSTPKKIVASSVYTDIAMGPDFSVALDRNGNMFSWGNNNSRQLGTGDKKSSSKPILIAAGTHFVSVKAGKNFALALDTSKHLWAWGSNSSGQPGTGNTDNLAVPTLVSNGEWNAIDASLVSETSVAIDVNQNLYAWGSNSDGQLGNGGDWRQVQADENARVAKNIQDAKDSDSARLEKIIAVCNVERKAQTDEWQAGQDAAKKKADEEKATPTPAPTPKPNSTPTPTPTPTPTVVVPVIPAPVWDKTCEELAKASFVPTDTSGMVAKNIPEPALTGNSATPIQIGEGHDYVSVAIGSKNGFAIDDNNVLRGWGSDANGQTGLGVTDDKAHTQTPLIISAGTKFSQVDAGDNFAAAVSTKDSLYVWGSGNKSGSLANADEVRNAPVNVKDGIVSVYLGAKTGYALDSSKTAYSWGSGDNGLLGNGEKANRSDIVSMGQTMNYITAGLNGAIGLNPANQLLTWGENSKGIFGNGETSDAISGITRNEISKFIDISAGRFFSVAIDTNNVVWAWGYNAFGQTGSYGAAGETTQPVVVPFDRKMKFVAAGENVSYAVAEDNTVWAWGNNHPDPYQIGSIEDGIKQISAGKKHLVVLDEKGNIWEYGNTSLGMYDFTPHDTLTKISKLSTTYIAISAGGESTLAITKDNQLVGWGDNSSGQLIVSDKINISTETILDKTHKYIAISMGETHALAIDMANVVYAWGQEPYGTFSNEISVVGKPRALPIFIATE